MIKTTLQNNGQLTTGCLLPVDVKGSVQSSPCGSENASRGGDSLPFSVIFTKMVNKASQIKEAVSSSTGRNASSAENAVSAADIAEEQRKPLFMMKIKGLPSGQEKEEDVLALELDLQALLQVIEDGKAAGENQSDPAGSGEAAASISSYLAAMISALQNQGGAIDPAGIGTSGQEATLGIQGDTETILSAIDKFLSSGGNLSTDGTDKGNKILLTMPQDLLKNFVINQNGQPHFSMNGAAEGPLTGEGEVAAVGQDVEGKTLQLVRLNTRASSSSPQGALLAAVMGSQKTHPSVQEGMKTDSENTDPDGAIPGNPSSGEALLKTAGEPRVRETLLPPETGNEPDGTAVKAGMDPQQGLLSPEEELGEQERIAASQGLEAGEDASAIREDAMKGARLIAGKESVQWVPNAGMSSPQVSPGAVASSKGVFIPMDEVVSKAGTALEKGGKVQMTLQPPSLGTINMEVVVQNNRVELVLTTGHADVQQMLQAGTDQLKSTLQNQGFQVDQMSVLLKQENFGFNPGGNPLWQDGSGQKENNGNGSSAFPSTPDAEPVISRDDYGTGTISIFA